MSTLLKAAAKDRRSLPARRPLARHLDVYSGAAISALYFALSVARQHSLRTGIDLGIYTQAVQRYANLQLPWSFIKGRGGFNLLGDHFSPIVATIAPVYRLMPSVETLLGVQAGLVGLAVFLFVRGALRILSPALAVALGLAFGLSWGTAGMALFDFHEVCFALPLLVQALVELQRRRPWRCFGWLVPLMLVKEDSAFLIAGVAGVLFLLGFRRIAALSLGYAAGAFALIVGVVIPHLSYSGSYTYWSVAGSSAAGGLTGSHVIEKVWNAITNGGWGTVILALLGSAGIALRSPIILAAIPPLLTRFASTNPAYWAPQNHYNATLMVIVFMAAVDGCARNRNQLGSVSFDWRQKLAPLIFLGMLPVTAAISWTPLSSALGSSYYRCDARCEESKRLARMVPDGASVAASPYLLDQMVDRCDVHLLVPDLRDSTGTTFAVSFILLDETTASGAEAYAFAVGHGYHWIAGKSLNAQLLAHN